MCLKSGAMFKMSHLYEPAGLTTTQPIHRHHRPVRDLTPPRLSWDLDIDLFKVLNLPHWPCKTTSSPISPHI